MYILYTSTLLSGTFALRLIDFYIKFHASLVRVLIQIVINRQLVKFAIQWLII